jgi:predicted ATPase
MATHSPILLACPGAAIYSLDTHPIRMVAYEDTSHYRVYRDFFAEQEHAAGGTLHA